MLSHLIFVSTANICFCYLLSCFETHVYTKTSHILLFRLTRWPFSTPHNIAISTQSIVCTVPPFLSVFFFFCFICCADSILATKHSFCVLNWTFLFCFIMVERSDFVIWSRSFRNSLFSFGF